MPESVITAIPQSSQWSITWNRVARDRRWTFLLIAMGVFSSIIYPHPPFVALSAVAGTTLKPKRAVLIAMSIWLMNQVYGYTVRQYPCSADSLLWGFMLGLGTLIVTALASLHPTFQKTMKGHCLWMGAISLSGFAVFESLILTVDWLLTGSHTLTWAIAQSLFIKETVWAIGLMLIHLLFIRFTHPAH